MSSPPGPDVVQVRHGETTWSKSGQHTGRTDIPLTQVGEAQARAVGTVLAKQRFALVLTSPLARAANTARLAGFDDAEVDPNLVEWNYGDYEGKTTAEIQNEVPGWSIWTGVCPHGETADQVAARADRVLARVQASVGPGQGALLFGHGHILRVLGARWLGVPPSGGGWLALGTGSISELGWEHANPVVEHWNDQHHLSTLLEEL
jgi:probable phosphoglycerate mutase